ncbi:MAG: hypothetical protein ACI7YS_04665 [Flavobacterium sp.]
MFGKTGGIPKLLSELLFDLFAESFLGLNVEKWKVFEVLLCWHHGIGYQNV